MRLLEGKLRLSEIIWVTMLLCFIVYMRFDLFFKDTDSINLNFERATIAVIGIVLVALALKYKSNKEKLYFARVEKYLLPFVIIIIAELIYSKIKYGYSLKNLINVSIPYLYVLFSIPVIYVICEKRSPLQLIKYIAYLQLLLLVIKTIAWYTVSYTNQQVFVNFATEFADWSRNGLQRIGLGPFFPIALVYFATKWLSEKKRIDLLIVAYLMLFLVFVSQSRTQVITAATCLFFMFYLTRRKRQSKVIIILAIVLIALFYLVNGYASMFISTFSADGIYGYSTLGRLESIRNFWNLYEKSYFFGLGLLENYEETASLFYRNRWEVFYLSDLGIIAGVFKFGFLSIPIYFSFIYKWYRMLKKYSDRINENSLIVIGIGIYAIIGGLINDYFSINIAMQFPIYLALLIWYGRDTKVKCGAKLDDYRTVGTGF